MPAALTENRAVRLGALGALYLGQGLPEGLLYVTVPAWLAAQGVPAGDIGQYIAIILLPWSLKLINGPVIERWTFLPMGRRRPWIVAAQCGLIGALLMLLAIPDPASGLGALTALGFAINFSASFQDVAIDGMAIDVLPEGDQAKANGIMWGSKIIGISASAGLSGALMAGWGFDLAVLSISLLMCLVLLVPLLLRERPGERLLPWSAGETSPTARALQLDSWYSIGVDLWRAIVPRASLLFILLTFSALVVYGLDTAALPVLAVQELSWTQGDFTNLAMWAGLAAGLFGMTIGGPLIDRFGTKRILALALALTAATHLAMAALRPYWTAEAVITAYMAVYGVLYVVMSIALYATAMRLCEKHVAATQFAIYMAVVNLGTSAGAAILGSLRAFGGYRISFVFMFLSSVFALGVLALFALSVGRQTEKSTGAPPG
ncbi:MFS transporter [Emcibacter sp. SYSU 3D8]|uniref:MFS transporter n=1 Tax=Emcibacter sp. SYSU 3D8 TaxID=3133969 RepID=UPI0031FE756C